MKLTLKTALFSSIFLSVAIFSGCSSDSSGRVTHTQFCKNKYDKAEGLFKKEKYGRVIDKAEEIIRNAHEFVRQFQDKKRETLISLLVLEKYFRLSGQIK